MNTYLIIGGAGFIGSHLAERLIKNGDKVIIYDTFQHNALIYLDVDILDKLIINSKSEDILNKDDLEQIFQCFDIDTIIHCASIAGIDAVNDKYSKMLRINLEGTQKVVDVANKFNVQKLVYLSTSEVYGQNACYNSEDEHLSIGGATFKRYGYAASKLAAEHIIATFDNPYIIIRPFNVYGSRQIGNGAIKTFIVNALKKEPIIITGGGSQIRAWCYIDDFIDAMIRLIYSDSRNETYNIGNPQEPVSIFQLANMITHKVGYLKKYQYSCRYEDDVKIRIPNIDKLIKFNHFNPKTNLEEGIETTIKWYKEYLKQF